MSVLNIHLSFFLFFSVSSLISSLLLFSLLPSLSSIYITFNLFSVWSLDLHVCFLFDWLSLSFSTVVLIISSIIIVYSYNYIAPYSKPYPFLWLTSLFVMSILVVIFVPNLFFVMLGWDGLGLVSFFLIVYYQNNSSIVSGIFTVLMNRLGDSFFLASLVILLYSSATLTPFSSSPVPLLLLCLFFNLLPPPLLPSPPLPSPHCIYDQVSYFPLLLLTTHSNSSPHPNFCPCPLIHSSNSWVISSYSLFLLLLLLSRTHIPFYISLHLHVPVCWLKQSFRDGYEETHCPLHS